MTDTDSRQRTHPRRVRRRRLHGRGALAGGPGRPSRTRGHRLVEPGEVGAGGGGPRHRPGVRLARRAPRRRHHRRRPRLHAERAARRAGRRGARRGQARRVREAADHHRRRRGDARPLPSATAPRPCRSSTASTRWSGRRAHGSRSGSAGTGAHHQRVLPPGLAARRGRRQLARRLGAGRPVAGVRRHRLPPGRPRRVRQRRPGVPPRRHHPHGVQPNAHPTRRITTEDAVAVVIETRSGALGTLLVSQVAPGRKNRLFLEIAGSAESVAFDQEQPETLWVGRREGSMLIPRDADQLAADAARLCVVPSGHAQGYQDAFNAFVADTYAAIGGARARRTAALHGRPAGRPGDGCGARLGRVRHLDRDGRQTMTDTARARSWRARIRSRSSPGSGPT